MNSQNILLLLDKLDRIVLFNRKSKIELIKNQVEALSDENAALEKIKNDLENENEKVKRDFSVLDKSHREISSKSNFINEILASVNNDTPAMKHFRDLFQNEFMQFANEESSLAEEAEVVVKLQEIEKELERVNTFPDIYNKEIVAIGGGFSSGKSSFINSLFKNAVVNLPIGIKPVTAIPTYVTSGNSNAIKGCSIKRGVFEIEKSFYEQLSHDFLATFSFNIKDIMPMMALETLLDYEHLCFVDTPGYNPAKTEFSSHDLATAKEYLIRASVLIWLIGVDSTGTIPKSDLDFIKELNLADKKLYIVLNKADIKCDSDLDDIMDSVSEALYDEDINYVGISSYSSIDAKEVMFRSISLFEFLKQENKNVNMRSKVFSELNEIFDKYEKAINADIQKITDYDRLIRRFELALFGKSIELEGDDLEKEFGSLKKFMSNESLVVQKEKLNRLRDEMLESAQSIFNEFDSRLQL